MAFPPRFLDELRERLTLSEVIGKRIRVTRAGREFKACCPFHNEKTPSFTINDQKGFYHCLAAETGVLLQDGVRPISQLAGTVQRVLTRGGVWVDAAFKSYGVQRLHRIEMSRNGLRKTLYATDGHRWFVRGVKGAVTTLGLRPGHRLESVTPQRRVDWSLDPQGVAHGVVFGDGSVAKGYGHVHLHGEKDQELAAWFAPRSAAAKVTENGRPYLRLYGGRDFGHMKDLPPLDAPESYLLGFLAGYLAADGHVAKDGTVLLSSAKREHLEWARAAANRLGLATYGVTTAVRRGLAPEPRPLHRIHFVPDALHPDFFLLSEARRRFSQATKRFARLRWVVRAVEPTDRVEEVYCAEVPVEAAFALEDNILTGNCFGCGAHGDVVGFVMRHDNLSFPEAVAFLASAAGLEVPETSAEDRQKAEKQKTLYDLVERACKWFESQLRETQGRAARGYLAGRGLSDDAMARFRLGYSPHDRHALPRLLKAEGFPDDDIVAAGLAKRPDDGGAIYSFFRNRAMFPVADRRGRVVAFGGRIMDGDGPKYVNTAETPLFHKGSLLYGLSRARQAAADGQPVVVAEGYMDVIALVEAGFGAAVAPLGTALTENQIQELWRLIPRDIKEPYLCFDGDGAGRRAAWRAVERILPHLGPGKSAKVAFLPEGEDPDSLIRGGGAKAMTGVLDAAIPLSEALWRMETEERRTDTPETKAALRAALEARVNLIADPAVKEFYRQDMRRRLTEALSPQGVAAGAVQGDYGFSPRNQRFGGQGSGGGWRPGGGRFGAPRRHVPGTPGVVTAPFPGRGPDRRRLAAAKDLGERLLLATLINHPALFDEVGERLGMAAFPSGPLEGLRATTVNALSRDSGLDAEALCRHLADCGYDPATLLSESHVHGKFARPDASFDEALEGWNVTWDKVREQALRRDFQSAKAALASDASEANFARFQALREELRRLTGFLPGADGPDDDEAFE